MNTFCEHHKNNIKFAYRCFDRILLNGLIQPFQQPERVIGFFNAYREGQRVTRGRLRDIAEQFGNWVKNRNGRACSSKKQSHQALASRRSTPAQVTRRAKSQTHR